MKSRNLFTIFTHFQDPHFNDIRVGLDDNDIKKCSDETALSNKKILMQSMTPKYFGRGIEPNFLDFVTLVQKGKKSAGKSAHRPTFMAGLPREIARAHEVINEEFLRKSELPSANVHASARALAKLAAMMANQGESLDGNERLMTHETWLKMHDREKRAFDAAMSNNRTNFTQGGINVYSLDEESTTDEKIVAADRLGFVGWAGYGGSIFQWHPQLKIGFAFVPTCLHWFDVANLRGGRIQKLVVDCAQKISANSE